MNLDQPNKKMVMWAVFLVICFMNFFKITGTDKFCVSEADDFKTVLSWNPYIVQRGNVILLRLSCENRLKLVRKRFHVSSQPASVA